MERIVLTFGYVPSYNAQAEIFCGDSESSGTIEMSFEIIDDEFLGIDNDTAIKVQGGDFWNPESKLYNKLSETISNYFGFNVSHQYLFGAYSLLLDEPNYEFDAFELIESEAGIVNNFSYHLQGRIYVRYYFEEEDEIFDEKVIVSKNTFSN